jgi:hypothetical protein
MNIFIINSDLTASPEKQLKGKPKNKYLVDDKSKVKEGDKVIGELRNGKLYTIIVVVS